MISHPLTPSCVLFLFLWKQLGVTQTFRNKAGFIRSTPQSPRHDGQQPGSMTDTCGSDAQHNWRQRSAAPAPGPLSCYGGCSSTQHPHAALWPRMSSRTSSENSFAPPAKKKKSIKHKHNLSQWPELSLLCVHVAVFILYFSKFLGIVQQLHKVVLGAIISWKKWCSSHR